jgi:type IV pilus assembly protein PilC
MTVSTIRNGGIVPSHYQSLDPPDESAAGERQSQTQASAAESAAPEIEQPEAAGSVQPVKTKKALFSIGKKVKPDVVMAFSRQLSSFLEAGIPVLDALEIVAQQSGSPRMRVVINDVRSSIHRGTSFAVAIDAHPEVFPAFYRAMLTSAEYTGNLDSVLSQLSEYLERDIGAKRQVKSALTYPIVVLVVAFAAMIVMSVFILPKFTGLYTSLGAELPLPTRMLIAFTNFMTSYWLLVLGAIALGFVAAFIIIGGQRGKSRRDSLAMKLPVIGNLFQLISLERFCRVLSSLSSAGVPLPLAIGLSADSTNNTLFKTNMVTVRDALIRGGGLYEPMAETGLFPIAARQMIQVGERTGMLGNQLGKAATYYEREVRFNMKRATELFQPAVILLVAAVVGFIAIAQVSAMYSIFGQVK